MDEKIEFKDETSGLGLENKEAFEKIENDLFRSDSFTQNIENTEEPSVYERPLIREEEVYQERTPIIEEKEEENIFSEPALEEKITNPLQIYSVLCIRVMKRKRKRLYLKKQ